MSLRSQWGFAAFLAILFSAQTGVIYWAVIGESTPESDVVPADVKARVDAIGSEILSGIKEIENQTAGNRTELKKHLAWLERLTADVNDVKAQSAETQKWCNATQDAITQATEDRWRKSDALERWNAWQELWDRFREENPMLRFSP